MERPSDPMLSHAQFRNCSSQDLACMDGDYMPVEETHQREANSVRAVRTP